MVVISSVADQYFFRVEGKSREISRFLRVIMVFSSVRSLNWVL